MALTSTPEQPLPVRTVARAIGDWINRLGRVWVEGQLTEIVRRPGLATVFLTLRDPVADVSLRLTCPRAVCDAVGSALTDGARVVVQGKPSFHPARGTLALAVTEIRPIGTGILLARLEQLRGMLAAEGLFAASRKRRPPFLPRAVGLITGRASAAERDVVMNARRRWPAVRIVSREVAVQGPLAVGQIIDALRELDGVPEVDVIVIARGGGSLEDLLPFSDEALVRAVAAATTPVVSAIGHEQDTPLLDFVADVRASTPTDAAKRVVPDVAEQLALVTTLRGRARRSVEQRLDREERWLADLRGRPALAAPGRELDRHDEYVRALRSRGRRCVLHQLERADQELAHALAQLHALSPAATLDRGYALVRRVADGSIVRDPAQATPGDALTVRVAGGSFPATVDSPPAGARTQTGTTT
ncbi:MULTISPECIES: exodeoxyribonuclease VII large subunit [Protofrankia]|uniref:Exodeoxyribonuclease 7 large subunit n=1 Tax=Candidatus Protofrankia datiscae TaxID=2716812 RepID=F8AWC6_9ACTN|nr:MULTISPECIES: exodeoxyribonuclease VII large subunit [Protofrankia]AEH08327.1 Exodeoxyribonuclease 7 large subunit [Candidatus Protofrankia datiscae]